MSSTVAELQAKLAAVQQQIAETQSAVGIVRDRNDGALKMLASATDGTGRESVSGALAGLASIDQLAETMISTLMLAGEQIDQYRQGL